MTSKFQIVTLPNPVLREPTKKIDAFDEPFQELTQTMRQIMHTAEGVGLAAPQIGQALKLAVIEYDPVRFKEETDFEIPFFVIANPKVIHRSQTTETLDEGCLSVPGAVMPVERATEVTVLAQDERGQRIRIRAKGFLARILQHEIDHLHGTLIVDRTADPKVRRKFQEEIRL